MTVQSKYLNRKCKAVPTHAMMEHRESRGRASVILNFGTIQI